MAERMVDGVQVDLTERAEVRALGQVLPKQPLGVLVGPAVSAVTRTACCAGGGWLRVVDVEWNRAASAEVRDFVLWPRVTTKPRRAARTRFASAVGTTNHPITKKTCLEDRYKPRTIRHSNAVLPSFCGFRIETGSGPLVNPALLARADQGPSVSVCGFGTTDPLVRAFRRRLNTTAGPRRPKCRDACHS
ncbi:hypothetical protein [Streptomyces sp. NPDC021356]|uniref:hypothetical protein n=1 Tax=Streptomyces sp. NPDC021356 TaxID=3154900 RepID=UPI0033CB600C